MKMKNALKKINDIYMQLPINLSTITGWRYPGIPRLLGNPILGRLSYFASDNKILQNLLAAGKLATNHPSGMCYYWLFNKLVLLITKPEQIENVLITNDENVSRRAAMRFVESFWGPNIVADERALWKEKKTIYLDHLSKHDVLTQYEPWMQLVTKKSLEKIPNNQQSEILLRDFIRKYTLEMILSLITQYDHKKDIEKFIQYTEFVGDNVANIRNIFKWSLPSLVRKFIFRNEPVDQKQVKHEMRCTFNKLLLVPNEDYIKEHDNFLHSIWQLRKDQPGQSQLQANADVFGDGNVILFAAQDTVTSTLEFAFKLLCANPAVEEKLRAELKHHIQNDELTLENLNRIEYLEMVIREVLRFFPASPMLPARSVTRSFEIDGLPLSKGSLILISPFITQRSDAFWENPEQFIPERFSKENKAKIPPHAFIPFGDGRHGCVGWKFAIQQCKFLLAAIYRNYHVEIENNEFQIKFFHSTIRPQIPTKARFIPIRL